MTITKNEKRILQVVGSIALFVLIFVGIVLPEMQTRETLKVRNEELVLEHKQKALLLKDVSVDQQYAEEVEEAKKNYNFFYSALNSYTIDKIINDLLKKYELNVSMLNITEYQDATYDFERLEEQELKVLVRSTVNINVSGQYQKILSFIEELNNTSPCLLVEMISITNNRSDATGRYEKDAILSIYIYGIDVVIENLEAILQ
ncbi:MAG: hypothetical protein ACRC7V_00265 [Lachnospiraceae bacterium]